MSDTGYKSDGRPSVEGHQDKIHFVYPKAGLLYHVIAIDKLTFGASNPIQIPGVTYTVGSSVTLVSMQNGLHLYFADSQQNLQRFRYFNGAWAADLPPLGIQSRVCPGVCCGPGGLYLSYLTLQNTLFVRISADMGVSFQQDMQILPQTGFSIASVAPSLCCTQNGIVFAYVSTTNRIVINQYSRTKGNIASATPFTAIASTGVSLSRASYDSNYLVLAWQDATGPSLSFIDQTVTPANWTWSTPTRNPQGNGTIDNGPELAFAGVHMVAAWRWTNDQTIGINVSDDNGVTWVATSSRYQFPFTRDVITRNQGIATAGSTVVVLDSQNNAWSIDISNAANPWQSFPVTTGGIDMIAVGDTSGNNTGWRLFGLNKASPSLYWHRPLSDHSSPWTQGNHGFADSPREMMSFSFGGSSQQFVFGVLTDGNYAVTHFPNGDWWKNWHADMGPQKPTPMTQLVTCASMNYALDAKGAVFSQTLWPPAVSQWSRLTQPGGQTVQLVAASKSYVWAYTTQGQLWKMQSSNSNGAWTVVPQISPANGLTPITFAASDDMVVFGNADSSISALGLSSLTISSVRSFSNNAVLWYQTPSKRFFWFFIPVVVATIAQIIYMDSQTQVNNGFIPPPAQVPLPPIPVVLPTKKATLIRCKVGQSQGMNIVQDIITNKFGFAAGNITRLDDQDPHLPDPSVALTRQAFIDLLQGTRAGDVRLFYFDGHGGSVADVNGDEPDRLDETLDCTDGELNDDDLAAAIVNNCHPKCNLTILVTTCHGGTLFDNQFNGQPGLVGAKRGISLAPVRDNQLNLANRGGDYWTYSFRDVISAAAAPADITYQALFDAMKVKYHQYPPKPSPNPNNPDPDKQDPLLTVDLGYMDPAAQKFLAPLP